MTTWATSLVAGVVFALASMAAAANDVVPAFDVDEIVAEQEQFRSQAIAGRGVFEDMTRQDRTLFEAQQVGLFDILRGRDYEELDENQRVAAFNHLEAIAAILNRAKDSRMVCERVKRVGTNRVERVCRSVADREREREETRDSPAMRYQNTCGGGRCAGSF